MIDTRKIFREIKLLDNYQEVYGIVKFNIVLMALLDLIPEDKEINDVQKFYDFVYSDVVDNYDYYTAKVYITPEVITETFEDVEVEKDDGGECVFSIALEMPEGMETLVDGVNCELAAAAIKDIIQQHKIARLIFDKIKGII